MKHGFNDGITQKYCEICPEGFKPGRINKKLTEAELRNKLLVEDIVLKYSAKDLIDYYINHNIKETLDYFKITNATILKKVLFKIGYDFSKQKPSKFKGKTAARSHDSYIAGGVKSAQTQKENWANKSEEEKEAWSEKQKEAHCSEDFRTKISIINKEYQKNMTQEEREQLKLKKHFSNKKTGNESKDDILAKAYLTRKQNNSFNSSKPEDTYYEKLLEIFNSDDIFRGYKQDSRYPHECDFYIKSLDFFIELNFSGTHGGHKFDSTNEVDLSKLEVGKEKAEASDYYKKAIDTGTRLDIEKFNDAINNNLKYYAFYSEQEADAFLKAIKKKIS